MSKILKFGGSSMAHIEGVIDAIKYNIKNSKKEGLGIVVSAVGKTTNNLQAMISNPNDLEKYKDIIIKEHINANTILSADEMNSFIEQTIIPYLEKAEDIVKKGNITDKEKAEINSYGERISYAFLSECLSKEGISNIKMDSGKLIHTYSLQYLDAFCDFQTTEKICKEKLLPILNEGKIVCITGYYGRNSDGEVSTLGRNASDTIASIIGTFCNVEETIIYTDVNGVYSDNPNANLNHRIIKLNEVSIEEMFEAANKGGASVLHEKVLDFMIQMIKTGHSISNLSVKHVSSPEEYGTKIVQDKTEGVKFLIDRDPDKTSDLRHFLIIGYGDITLEKIMEISASEEAIKTLEIKNSEGILNVLMSSPDEHKHHLENLILETK